MSQISSEKWHHFRGLRQAEPVDLISTRLTPDEALSAHLRRLKGLLATMSSYESAEDAMHKEAVTALTKKINASTCNPDNFYFESRRLMHVVYPNVSSRHFSADKSASTRAHKSRWSIFRLIKRERPRDPVEQILREKKVVELR